MVPDSLTQRLARTDFDVAVIGAGPAGAFAAFLLARRKLSVLLVDKEPFPRRKVCGGCLNAGAVELLDRAGLPLNAAPLESFRLHCNGGVSHFRLRGGRVISRDAFDEWLAEHACRQGALFLDGTAAELLPDDDGEAKTIRLASGTETQDVRARVVLLATGITGRVAPGVPDWNIAEGSRLGAGALLPAVADDSLPPAAIDMHVGGGGYVGFVRLENDEINAAAALDSALVREQGGIAGAVASIAADYPPALREVIANSPWKATPQLTRSADAVAGVRLFHIGDSAGYIEPFTGEGMAIALREASLVLEPVIRALSKWDPSLIGEWSALVKGRRRTGQWVCRNLGEMLRNPARTEKVARLVAGSNLLSRAIVKFVDRPLAGGTP